MHNQAAPRGIGRSVRHPRQGKAGKQATRFLGWNRIVQETTEDAQLRIEGVIDAYILVPIVEDVAPRPCQRRATPGAGRKAGIRVCSGEFGIDILDVSCSYGIDSRDLCPWNAGARGGVAHANLHWQGSRQFCRGRQLGAGKRIVGDNPAPLLGEEKESLALDDWSSNGVSEIVPTQRRARKVREVVEIVIGLQYIIAEELVGAAMKRVRPRAGGNIELAARASSVLRQIIRPQHLDFGYRIDAGEGQ